MLLKCKNCGYFGMLTNAHPGGTIVNHGTIRVPCPQCETLGEAMRGTYSYSESGLHTQYYVTRIVPLSLSRSQSKRFVKLVSEAKELESVPLAAGLIDSELGELASEAIANQEPRKRLNQIAMVVAILAGIAGTIYTGLQITEKLGLLDDVQKAIEEMVDAEPENVQMKLTAEKVRAQRSEVSFQEKRKLENKDGSDNKGENHKQADTDSDQ